MRRLAKATLGAAAALGLAAAVLLATNAELRSTLEFAVSPSFGRDQHFVRLTSAAGVEVFVLGTIHGDHLTARGYGLRELRAAIEHLRPDVLLVESRPEELDAANRCDGPVEMGFANLVAERSGIETRGFDFWERIRPMPAARNSDAREDQMFSRARRALEGHRRALMLVGYSHVPGMLQRFHAAGFTLADLPAQHKASAFDTSGVEPRYPPGFTACLERRIGREQEELDRETDPGWQENGRAVIAARRGVVEAIPKLGEEPPRVGR